jgi:hypothetical protein
MRARRDGTILAVLKHATTPVAIELELGVEPIAGSLRVDAGASTRFRGWLELTSLLQEAAAGPTEPSRATDPAS